MATLHVKYRDQSHDLEMSNLFPASRLAALGISDDEVSASNLTDEQIKAAVADHLDVNHDEFRSYSITRESNGNVTVRPQAVFG